MQFPISQRNEHSEGLKAGIPWNTAFTTDCHEFLGNSLVFQKKSEKTAKHKFLLQNALTKNSRALKQFNIQEWSMWKKIHLFCLAIHIQKVSSHNTA